MGKIELDVNEIACTSCITKMKKRLKGTTGIKKVEILPGAAALVIDFNETVINSEKINACLQKIAFKIFD